MGVLNPNSRGHTKAWENFARRANILSLWDQILYLTDDTGNQVQMRCVLLYLNVAGNVGAEDLATIGRLQRPDNHIPLSKWIRRAEWDQLEPIESPGGQGLEKWDRKGPMRGEGL